MIKRAIKVLLAVSLVALAALYLPLDFLRAPVERALERGLARKVEVGQVHLDLFGAPGFTLDDVVIHEDPRAGIEPFAYVPSLDARLRWLPLFRGHIEFDYLNLGEGNGEVPTLNIVKTAQGPWNFQFLLDSATSGRAAVPAIRMRTGRVNFKFGDIKSVFYFNEADLNVSPSGRAVELRFEGSPSRTDRASQDFGRFFLNGDWNPSRTPRLNMNVDLQRSSLDEVSRLIDPRGFGVRGTVAMQAQLSGAPTGLDVAGLLEVDDVHRSDIAPGDGGLRQKLPFKGSLNLRGEMLELASELTAPVALSLRAWDFLSKTQWEAGVQLNHVPVADVVEASRHVGIPLPDQLAAQGAVGGSLVYNEDGLNGRIELEDASLLLPDVQPLRTKSAVLDVGEGEIGLEPSIIAIGDKETAELRGSYSYFQPREIDLRITTKGMSVADMRSFGLAAIPMLDQTRQGTWRGWARYRGGEWSGEYDLLNARIPVDGLADPLRLQSASVKLDGIRAAVSKIRAHIGEIAFTGEYHWDPNAVHPHKFAIAVEDADTAEVLRLLAPTLVRERGFLARTLRLGAAPAPEWLKNRRADGTISIGSLTVGDTTLSLNQARLLWDGALVRLAGVDGNWLSTNLAGASFAGDIEADLSGGTPGYRLDGKFSNVPYKGGRVDFEGSLDGAGEGLALLDSLHAEGHLRAHSIAFSADADFPFASACFEFQSTRWKFGSVEVMQGGETYYGNGASQSDGKLVLDLLKGSRSVRFSGPLLASAP